MARKSEKGLKGLRKRASKALPSRKGSKRSGASQKVNGAVDAVRNRVGSESRKRSKAAKKGARTRTANEAKLGRSVRKRSKTSK
jgi:hypothetical protein